MNKGTVKSVAGSMHIFQEFSGLLETAVSETAVSSGGNRSETNDTIDEISDESVQFALSAWRILSQ